MGFFSSPFVVFGLLLLLIGLVAILIYFDKKQRQKQNEQKNVLQERIQDSIANVRKLAEEAGLDIEVVYESAGVSEEEILNICAYPPPCSPSFYLNAEGCCELRNEDQMSPEAMKALMAAEAIKDIAIFMSIGMVIEWIALKLGQLTIKSVRNGIQKKVSKELGEEIGEKVVEKLVYKTEKEIKDKMIKELVDKGVDSATATSKVTKTLADNPQIYDDAVVNALNNKQLIKEAVAEGSAEAVEKATGTVAKKAGGEIAEKVATEVIEKGITKSLRITFISATSRRIMSSTAGLAAKKMMFGGARMMSKFLIGISSGPVGWAIMLTEVVFMVLDIFDVEGYSQFKSRELINSMRKNADFQLEKYAKSNGIEWPMLFPLQTVFPTEMEETMSELPELYYEDGLQRALEKDPEFTINFLITLMMDETPSEQDFTKLSMYINDAVNEDTVKRDNIFYYKLKSKLPSSEQGSITLYPSLSTEKRYAVSLTKGAVIKYNDKNRNKHLQDEQALIPIFTDRYYQLNMSNPGTNQRPNMVFGPRLREPAPLIGLYHTIFQQCEGVLSKQAPTKALRESQPDIDAYKLGVRFNDEDGSCIFSRTFCERMGLKYSSSGAETDCVPHPGQKGAEWFFGPTIVRGLIRIFD